MSHLPKNHCPAVPDIKIFEKAQTPEEKLLFLKKHERRLCSWRIASGEFAPVLERLRNTPPELTAEAGLINESSGKYVWKVDFNTSEGPASAAYKTNPGKTPWRYIFKPSLPVREAENYFLFETLGIPVAPVIAVGDDRKNFILHETFIATKFIENTSDGRQFMPGGPCCDQHEKKLLFCRMNLLLLAKLHHAGIFHKAFHPRNLLWREKEGVMEVFWIDVARCRKVSPGCMHRAIVKDLHTFFRDMHLTRAETAELTDVYMAAAPAEFLPESKEKLLEELIRFKRRLFSKKCYRLFSDGN